MNRGPGGIVTGPRPYLIDARERFRHFIPTTADPVLCDRCGQPADATRVDISTRADPHAWCWGRITCTTPGCVDEDGSYAVPPPDVPGELTREDRRWIRQQERLAKELVRADRLLMDATGGP